MRRRWLRYEEIVWMKKKNVVRMIVSVDSEYRLLYEV